MTILDVLFDRKIFIVYRAEPKADGKTNKFPVDPLTTRKINGQDPGNWMLPAEAMQWANYLGDGYGVGIVIHESSGLWFVDLDHCLGEQGVWMPHAVAFEAQFPGAYVETSVSGTGRHIIGTTQGPVIPHSSKNKIYNMEAYSARRFCALTGKDAQGSPLADFTNEFNSFVQQYFPPRDALTNGWTDGPAPGWNGPADDAELLRRALRSGSWKQIKGAKASFAELYNGDADVLTNRYGGDESSRDQAFFNHLAFWTGSDCERMVRLAKNSSLMRDKWDRTDYIENTVLRACASQTKFYGSKTETPAPVVLPFEVPDPPGAAIAGSLKTVKMSDVVAKPIEPLWPGCLYKGKVTVLAGIPGDGKSLTAVDIAARITMGKVWPVGDGQFVVSSVLLLTAEDDPEDTIRPRLDVAVADTTRVELIQGVHRTDATGARSLDTVSLANDLPAIEHKIVESGAALLIVDPLTSFADSDTNETAAMRRLLDGLVAVAARTGVAILIITHMNKRSDARKAMQMIAGNHVIVAAVRVVLVTARDPNDTDRMLLLPIKLNIGPRNLGFGFRVAVKPHDVAGSQPVVDWEPEMVDDMSADDVLIDSTPRAQAAVEKSQEVQEWLREALANGPLESKPLFDMAKTQKFSERRVRDALKAIKAKSSPQGQRGKWLWELSEHSGVIPAPPFLPKT